MPAQGLGGVRVLLCDGDGTLFPSEEPAFDASAEVTNDFLTAIGVQRRYTATELRLATTGQNFRATAGQLAAAAGVEVAPDVLEDWVRRERDRVTEHLGSVLAPDPATRDPLARLAAQRRLALVSSSALRRLQACLHAAGLAEFFPEARRFSAEDSLAEPRSKPAPDVYLHAAATLEVRPAGAIAIEDALPGVQSAVAAGIPVLGFAGYVPEAEREARVRELLDAGARVVAASWSELEAILDPVAAEAA